MTLVAVSGAAGRMGRLVARTVADLDGATMVKTMLSGPPENAVNIGLDLADRLLDMGAGPILESLKLSDAT